MEREYLITKIVEMTSMVVPLHTIRRIYQFVQRLYKKELG